jgi:hypothetical protein
VSVINREEKALLINTLSKLEPPADGEGGGEMGWVCGALSQGRDLALGILVD